MNNPLNVVIRETSQSDLSFLSKIYPTIYTDTLEIWTDKMALKLFNFYMAMPNSLSFTALYNRKIVGAFFSYMRPWYDGNHLGEGELFVAPEYQKHGIGSQLYYTMMVEADKRGCIDHELLTYIGKPADFWYKRLGFKKTGQIHYTGRIKGVIKKLETLSRK